MLHFCYYVPVSGKVVDLITMVEQQLRKLVSTLVTYLTPDRYSINQTRGVCEREKSKGTKNISVRTAATERHVFIMSQFK